MIAVLRPGPGISKLRRLELACTRSLVHKAVSLGIRSRNFMDCVAASMEKIRLFTLGQPIAPSNSGFTPLGISPHASRVLVVVFHNVNRHRSVNPMPTSPGGSREGGTRLITFKRSRSAASLVITKPPAPVSKTNRAGWSLIFTSNHMRGQLGWSAAFAAATGKHDKTTALATTFTNRAGFMLVMPSNGRGERRRDGQQPSARG